MCKCVKIITVKNINNKYIYINIWVKTVMMTVYKVGEDLCNIKIKLFGYNNL